MGRPQRVSDRIRCAASSTRCDADAGRRRRPRRWSPRRLGEPHRRRPACERRRQPAELMLEDGSVAAGRRSAAARRHPAADRHAGLSPPALRRSRDDARRGAGALRHRRRHRAGRAHVGRGGRRSTACGAPATAASAMRGAVRELAQAAAQPRRRCRRAQSRCTACSPHDPARYRPLFAVEPAVPQSAATPTRPPCFGADAVRCHRPTRTSGAADRLADARRAAKYAMLRRLFDDFARDSPTPLAADFERFVREGGESLPRHARFEARAERRRRRRYHALPAMAGRRRLRRGADRRPRAAGMRIGLITDLAVGIDRGGSARLGPPVRICCRACSIGAPPDIFNPQRPGLGPHRASRRARWSASGFEPFIATLRAGMRACRRRAHRSMRWA